MFAYILYGILFFTWSIFTIYTYYSGSYGGPNHIEQAVNYSGYITLIFGAYLAYKAYTIFIRKAGTISFGFWKILGFTLLHILIMSVSYFQLPEAGTAKGGVVLFTKICTYLLYPFFLVLLARSSGFTILTRLFKDWKNENIKLRVLIETSIGFCIYTSLLLIIGQFSFYTFGGMISILAIMSILSIPGWKETWNDIQTRVITIPNHRNTDSFLDLINPRLLSIEWMFLVITFVMSVSFVSIMRPMPIGWDDLGVYMNWPKIMALNEEVLHGAGFFAWQIITGTGFLFDMSAPQAFFINQVGGILFIIAIILSASLLFGEKQTIQNEKGEKIEKEVNHIISLPILLAGIMYTMPMIIFQQAKDMKLDPALLFFSITGITALWYGWKHKTIEHKRFFPYFAHKHQELDEPLNTRENHKFLILVGVLIGFAFTVKITTLMIILAGFAYIFYRYLGLLGLLSFTGFFISIFTGLRLWDMLNVVYPKNDLTFIQTTTTIALIIGAFLLGLSTWRHGFTRLKNTIISILLVTLGIVISTSPWIIKNISESGSLKTQGILWGSGGYKIYDHGVIYSKEELKKIEDGSADLLSASGQSSNEDLGRYFGYEKGVNNYLKLPTNLTFQKNQPGEFTDITYIYLALIPVLFIFLVSRNQIFSIVTLTVLFGAYTYYFGFNDPTGSINALFGFSGDTLTTSQAITRYLESWNLPEGYLIILAIFVFGVTAFDLLLTPTERNRKIRGVVIFTAFYSFIFVISAFGIVWYGIAVYFCFLILIGFSALSFTTYSDEEEKKEGLMTVKILLSLALFIVVNTYFIRSTFPHGWNNLRQSSFTTFKAGKIDQETAIFESHPDYLETIAALNLKDPKATMIQLIDGINNPILSAILKNELSAINILRYSQGIQYGGQDQISAFIANGLKAGILTDEAIKKGLPTLKSDTEKLRKKFYNTVLYPSKDIANNSGIYRIGTFMTYFIYNNMWRYYDDSLVINFDKYFYDPTPEATVERMKKMDVNFFLTDLNAATIDKDPRHNLTKRFEELLLTFRAKNLELIDTDSLCLRLAVDEWHRGNLTEDTYLALAGVNYESYPASGGVIYRGQKQINCYNYMIGLMQGNKVNQKDYPYLLPIMQAIGTKEKPSQDEIVQIFQQYVTHGWFAFFRMK